MTIPSLKARALAAAALLAMAVCAEPRDAALPSPVGEERLRVVAVGDVIPHQTVLNAFRDAATGAYDFRPAFAYVKPMVEAADLSLCNVETVFTGDGSYSGYPSFDSPDSLAAALKDSGFAVGITANNHQLDQGTRGFDGTIDALRRAGLVVAGTRKPGEPRFAMVEVKGAKVAVIAYTYVDYDAKGVLGLNSIPLTPQLAPRLNYFTERELDAGIAQIKSVVGAAREAGAELVIAYYHWGTEYALAPRPSQIALARASAEMGIDAVFGSHPHVLQRAEILRSPAGKEIPVFYSLGNFLSNQRRDTVDNRLTEDGMIASVGFRRRAGERAFALASADALATWVDKRQDGVLSFRIIPIDGSYRENPTVAGRGLGGDVEASLAATKNALGAASFSESRMLFTFFEGDRP